MGDMLAHMPERRIFAVHVCTVPYLD